MLSRLKQLPSPTQQDEIRADGKLTGLTITVTVASLSYDDGCVMTNVDLQYVTQINVKNSYNSQVCWSS